ncbi:MAG: tRNA uracil 4-sulfurtransferase ThiI [Myxococcota bacterium]
MSSDRPTTRPTPPETQPSTPPEAEAHTEPGSERGFRIRERLLIRLSGDLTTKGRATRARFVRRLVRNLSDALREGGGRFQLRRTHDRIYVDTEQAGQAETLARVFGIQSLSRVERRPWDGVDDLVEAGVECFGELVRGRRFAVRARRIGDRSRVKVESRTVETRLGARLLPESAGVDLDRPEVTAALEISPEAVHLFRDRLPGPAGLPLGTEGRALALVSGGFDSAVAAWHIQKRGVELDHLFCNLGGRSHQLGTLRVMKVIADRWSYGSRPRFHAVDFDPISRHLQERTRQRYWQVILKRLMYRAAERVAAEVGAAAAVTGEAVGQVSSQTLQNLAVIARSTELPVLRPLVGFNKEEIIDRARAIGTYDVSKVVGEYCAMVPRKPATGAKLDDILAEEARLDLSLVERAVDERQIINLRQLDLDKFDDPRLEASDVPEGAVVLDLRSKHAFRAWHYPGALFLDFAHALEVYAQLDPHETYVLYCEFGLKSAHLAELMRARGIDAVHFRHGLRDVVEIARHKGLALPDAVTGL